MNNESHPGDLSIDEIMRIQDVSTDTLFALVNRIELSDTIDHFFFRETELDEVWRHARADVDMAIRKGDDPAVVTQLEKVRDTVFEAHDLVGEGKRTRRLPSFAS